MIEIGILEGIRKLKERFIGEHPSAMEQIDTWEKRLQELSGLEDYVNLKTTQEIATKLRGKLRSSIMKRIIESETPEEKSIKYFLSLLSPNYRAEIEKIKSEIEFELSE